MALTFKQTLATFWAQIVSQFVRQENGKGLTTNDFTDEYKDKLNNAATTEYVTTALTEKQPVGDYALKSELPPTINNIKDGTGAKALIATRALRASGTGSFAAGWNTEVYGQDSTAFGYHLRTAKDKNFTIGKYNKPENVYQWSTNTATQTFNTSNSYTTMSTAPTLNTITGQVTYPTTTLTLGSNLLAGMYVKLSETAYCSLRSKTSSSGTTVAFTAYIYTRVQINTTDSDAKYAFTVGNGSSDTARSNAHALNWDGNAYYAGDVYVQGNGANNFVGSKKVATEDYVDEAVAGVEILQSDWNQSDTTAKDYVKNRTHWDEYEIVTFPDRIDYVTSGESVAGGAGVRYAAELISQGKVYCPALVSGESYTVMWNGVAYTSTCVELSEEGTTFYLLGNLSALGIDTPDADKPFGLAITTDKEGATIVVSMDASTEPTISITGPIKVTHKLDSRFLPNSNILNGSEDSIRSVMASREDDEYTMGDKSIALGYNSYARGQYGVALGYGSAADGEDSFAVGSYAQASGKNTVALGPSAYATQRGSAALGYGAKSRGEMAVAVGTDAEALATNAHAFGFAAVAKGTGSTALGREVIASGTYQTAIGKYNVEDSLDTYSYIVGNGTSGTNRKNAMTIANDGTTWFQGDVYVGSTSGTNKDTGSKKLATEKYVDNATEIGTLELKQLGESEYSDLTSQDQLRILTGYYDSWSQEDKEAFMQIGKRYSVKIGDRISTALVRYYEGIGPVLGNPSLCFGDADVAALGDTKEDFCVIYYPITTDTSAPYLAIYSNEYIRGEIAIYDAIPNIAIDPTLSVSGVAADAKVVGDALAGIGNGYLPLTGGILTGSLFTSIVAPKQTNTHTLGTQDLRWSDIYAKTISIVDSQYTCLSLYAETANSSGKYTRSFLEGSYLDNVGMWVNSDSTNDTRSRRGLVLEGFASQSNVNNALKLRQCNTSGTWLSDLYILHSGNYSSYALPLTGGTVTGVTTFSNTTDSTSTTTGAVKISGGLGVAGSIYSNKVVGAVWNDYAEYRITKDAIEPGRVVVENGDDTLSLATERLMPGANVVSDTYGFIIGETEQAKTAIAVSGRALVYTHEARDIFKAGDPVCSGPNGTVSKMTREEVMMYPERIIGTVSAIPTYEEWGTNKVKVNGRIWISIR